MTNREKALCNGIIHSASLQLDKNFSIDAQLQVLGCRRYSQEGFSVTFRITEVSEVQLEKLEKKLNRIPDYKQETKRYKSLLKKKERLEIRLTDTWISNNLHKVPYNRFFDKIHFTKMEPENYIKSSIADIAHYNEKSKERQAKSVKGISKIVTNFVIGLVSASLVFIPFIFQFDVEALIIVLVTVTVSCLFQFFSGKAFANQIFKQEIKAPIIYKTDMLEDYENWILKNPNIKSDYRKELEEKALCEAKNEIMKKLTEEVENIDEGGL